MRTRTVTLAVATATALLGAPLAARATTTTSTTVVFLAEDANQRQTVFTMPADGSADGTALFATDPDVDVDSAAVSPDGSTVAYALPVHAPDGDWVPTDIWVRATDGTGSPVRLTAADDGVLDALPAWSADGTTIAFDRFDPAAGTNTVWTVPADGGAAATLVPGTSGAYQPAFSPSGRQLAVAVANSLAIVTIASGARATVPGTTYGSEPSWSPDGTTIAFARTLSAECSVGLFSVPAGGGTATTLRAVDGHVATEPHYSRDGSQLYWSEYSGCDGLDANVWSGAANASGAAPVRATASLREFHASVGGGSAPASDTTAPAAPAITSATVGATSARLAWTAASDATEFTVVRVAHGGSPAGGTVAYDGSARSATVTGLTTGTVYDLYVYARDAWGNASPASAVHAVRPTAPPVMTPIGLHLGPDPSLHPSWHGAYAPYHAEVARKGTPFRTLADTSKTSTYYSTKQGVEYDLRVRGTDGLGNATGYSPTIRANVPLDEEYYGMRFSAGWDYGNSNSRYATTLRWHTARGASVAYTDNTSGFVVIGDRCPGCGRVRVYIDGIYSTTVDTYSATPQYRQVLYRRDGNGVVRTRTITLVVEGTAGRPRVTFDALAMIR